MLRVFYEVGAHVPFTPAPLVDGTLDGFLRATPCLFSVHSQTERSGQQDLLAGFVFSKCFPSLFPLKIFFFFPPT